MTKIIYSYLWICLGFRQIVCSMDDDEDEEETETFQRMMRFISKSNQGSIPKVLYKQGVAD